VEQCFKETPNQLKTVLAHIDQDLGKSVSKDTVKRALKAADYGCKRARRSLRSKRNDVAYEAKKKTSKSSKP